jgi:hypothetical protein
MSARQYLRRELSCSPTPLFAEDRVDIGIIEPPELTNHDIDEFPDTDEH